MDFDDSHQIMPNHIDQMRKPMRNWRMLSLVSAILLVAVAATYLPASIKAAAASVSAVAPSSLTANLSHVPLGGMSRVAQSQCIDHGQTCTINGTPCCQSTDSCSGTFPNTICQAK
jgi:hypothetical protein